MTQRLTPSERLVVELLAKREQVPFEAFYPALWPMTEPDSAMSVLRQHVCRARRKLRPYGLDIKAVWGCYRLTEK